MSVLLLDGHQVAHRRDHAAELGLVLLDHDVADPLEPERSQAGPLGAGAADGRPLLPDLQPCHESSLPAQLAPAAARARSMAAGATSSSGRPRLAAISSGR